jgi:hypothetical protein
MKRKLLGKFMILLTISIVLFSCGGGGDSGTSGGSGSNIGAIDARYEAEDAVRRIRSAIYDKVLYSLSNGTFSGTIVNGISGSATVTGTESSASGVSCGTDCVRSTYDAVVTVVFNNYKFNYASNNAVTLSGTVLYTEHWSSTQSGLSYSSSQSITVRSSGQIQYYSFVDLSSGDYGYQDTITFDATSSSGLTYNGTLTNGANVTFSL